MNLSRIISTAAKTVTQQQAAEQRVIKGAQNVIQKTSSTLTGSVPDILERLPKNASFHKFSAPVQEQVLQFRNNIWQIAQSKNDPRIFTNNDSFITSLLTHCDNEQVIKAIFKDVKNYNIYRNTKAQINKKLKDVVCTNINPDQKNKIFVDLTLMALFNPQNFKALCKSKGMKEIVLGRLNIAYIKDLKPFEKFDEDFFYKLFDNIEKSTNNRLLKAGIDTKAANRYIKLADEEICKNPKVLEDFITKIEQAKNPELVNQILKDFKINEYFIKYQQKDLMELLDNCATSPDIVKKVLQIQKKHSPYCTNAHINMFKSKDCNISNELFEYYLNFEKTNPECCFPTTLLDIDNFLSRMGNDEKILKEILEKTKSLKKPYITSEILNSTNSNNLEFLKKCLQNKTLNPESIFKLKMMGFNVAEENKLNEVCKEVYRPFMNIFKKHYPCEEDCFFRLERFARMKIEHPEAFEKLEKSGVLDLVLQEKINPRILTSIKENGDFIPEVYSDIKMLLNGESLVKKFDSINGILQKTKPGDVVSVKGKLYINNNGKLEPWNMTEEKFNELFPLVDRFTTQQGAEDCYLFSVLNNIYQNPKTRGSYYKMFEQKGNDIFVTIPAYKDFQGTVKFPNGDITLTRASANAAKNVQMIEQTFARTSLRKPGTIEVPNSQNPVTTEDLEYLYSRIRGGQNQEVLADFLANLRTQGRSTTQTLTNKEQIEHVLSEYGQNQNYIFNENFLTGPTSGHSISIKSYNPETATVSLVDPMSSYLEEKVPIKDMLKNLYNFVVTRYTN